MRPRVLAVIMTTVACSMLKSSMEFPLESCSTAEGTDVGARALLVAGQEESSSGVSVAARLNNVNVGCGRAVGGKYEGKKGNYGNDRIRAKKNTKLQFQKIGCCS